MSPFTSSHCLNWEFTVFYGIGLLVSDSCMYQRQAGATPINCQNLVRQLLKCPVFDYTNNIKCATRLPSFISRAGRG